MRYALALALAACGGSTPAPATPPVSGAAAPVDAAEAPQEERLAAIQKAMNELDESAQGCWAAAAVQRFDIAGDLVMEVAIDGPGKATATVARDTTSAAAIGPCMVVLMGAYPWAPPLYGQTIQLPFKFRAPDGQNVIDRRLVPANGQGGVAVRVLLDDANTGNANASMFGLAVQRGATTGMRVAERAELWYFETPAMLRFPGGRKQDFAAGEMMFVPPRAGREVMAPAGDVHAAIVVVPGGKEGAARAGALPTPLAPTQSLPGPTPLHAYAAKTSGAAMIFAEPATIHTGMLSASVLRLPAGARVPEHVHARETELVYVLEGSGTLDVGGVALPVTPTSVIQVPPNTKHSFAASSDVRVVQIFTPAGPEQQLEAPAPTP
jgi:quercetin dioxygenase-like cupin family protein